MGRPPIYDNVTCLAPDCDKRAISKGMCGVHYARMRRLGSFDAPVKQSAKGEALRFLRNLPSTEECITWPFGTSQNGYGVVQFRGRQTSASRVSCIIYHGDPPESSHQAAHDCGNGHLGCVNPRHLKWATPLANTLEKDVHGTMLRGESHPRAKLTADDVREIRRRYRPELRKQLAEEFGIKHSSHIWAIASRKIWRSV